MKPAVIVDVDGTLCDITGVLRYLDGTEYGFRSNGKPVKNFDRFHEAAAFCPPNDMALQYVTDAADRGHTVIIVTARMERHRASTEAWLRNVIPAHIDYEGPLMRAEGDFRRDVEVKREIHAAITEHAGFTVVGAIDDNPNIIALWEELGIPTVTVPRPPGDVSLVVHANKEGGA